MTAYRDIVAATQANTDCVTPKNVSVSPKPQLIQISLHSKEINALGNNTKCVNNHDTKSFG